ncbi:MAG: DMT family transporter [Bacteroidota bacterium]
MDRSKTKGYLYALGAALALSASFVFSKSALNHLNMVQFGLIWFGIGVIWNLLSYFFTGAYRTFRESMPAKLYVAILIAVLEAAATGLFYIAIKKMENPAVVSFIGNAGPVFVTIMGITLLRERFSFWQMGGILITIAGIFVINYNGTFFGGFADHGSVYVLSASFLFALATIAGRRYSSLLDPGLMSLIRSFILSLAFLAIYLSGSQDLRFSLQVWRDLTIGSMLETLLTIVFAYQALRFIEATRTSLIISTKGVWTLVLAWVFLGVFPLPHQLAGGLLTLAGVWLITGLKASRH